MQSDVYSEIMERGRQEVISFLQRSHDEWKKKYGLTLSQCQSPPMSAKQLASTKRFLARIYKMYSAINEAINDSELEATYPELWEDLCRAMEKLSRFAESLLVQLKYYSSCSM